MNDIDLDRLGDVWRAQPDPAEIERLRRSAEAVRSRALWAQFADFGIALVVSGVVIALVLSNPQIKTAMVGGAAILFILYNSMRQRQLRQQELRTLSGSTEQMLDQSIARSAATIKRTKVSLIALVPSLFLGICFGAVLDDGSGKIPFERIIRDPLAASIFAFGVIAATAIVCVGLVRTLSKARRERERLLLYRESFRTERAADGPA